MDVKDSSLRGFKSGLEVCNFPIADTACLDVMLPKLRLLRQIEKEENADLGMSGLGPLLRFDGVESGAHGKTQSGTYLEQGSVFLWEYSIYVSRCLAVHL